MGRTVDGVVTVGTGLVSVGLGVVFGGSVVLTLGSAALTVGAAVLTGVCGWGVWEVLQAPGDYLWNDGLRFVVALFPAIGAGLSALAAGWLGGLTLTLASFTASLVPPLAVGVGATAALGAAR